MLAFNSPWKFTSIDNTTVLEFRVHNVQEISVEEQCGQAESLSDVSVPLSSTANSREIQRSKWRLLPIPT